MPWKLSAYLKLQKLQGIYSTFKWKNKIIKKIFCWSTIRFNAKVFHFKMNESILNKRQLQSSWHFPLTSGFSHTPWFTVMKNDLKLPQRSEGQRESDSIALCHKCHKYFSFHSVCRSDFYWHLHLRHINFCTILKKFPSPAGLFLPPNCLWKMQYFDKQINTWILNRWKAFYLICKQSQW